MFPHDLSINNEFLYAQHVQRTFYMNSISFVVGLELDVLWDLTFSQLRYIKSDGAFGCPKPFLSFAFYVAPPSGSSLYMSHRFPYFLHFIVLYRVQPIFVKLF